MRKVGRKDDEQLRHHQLEMLAEILSKTKNKEEILSILNSILTSSEKAAIAQRIAIIYRIRKNKQYWEIESELGTSSSTISKSIDIYLKHGADNATFDDIISRYDEPKFRYKSTSKITPIRNSSTLKIGIKQILKEEERRQKIWKKNRKQSS